MPPVTEAFLLYDGNDVNPLGETASRRKDNMSKKVQVLMVMSGRVVTVLGGYWYATHRVKKSFPGESGPPEPAANGPVTPLPGIPPSAAPERKETEDGTGQEARDTRQVCMLRPGESLEYAVNVVQAQQHDREHKGDCC